MMAVLLVAGAREPALSHDHVTRRTLDHLLLVVVFHGHECNRARLAASAAMPHVTRGFLPRSWTSVTLSKPAAVKRSRTASAWSKPCSTTSAPPGSRWMRAAAQMRS